MIFVDPRPIARVPRYLPGPINHFLRHSSAIAHSARTPAESENSVGRRVEGEMERSKVDWRTRSSLLTVARRELYGNQNGQATVRPALTNSRAPLRNRFL